MCPNAKMREFDWQEIEVKHRQLAAYIEITNYCEIIYFRGAQFSWLMVSTKTTKIEPPRIVMISQ